MATLFAFWVLVGWCGTVPRPIFPKPPAPDPWPWWRNPVLGLIGGIAGGLVVHYGLGLTELVATSFGALAGGRIASELTAAFSSQKM